MDIVELPLTIPAVELPVTNFDVEEYIFGSANWVVVSDP